MLRGQLFAKGNYEISIENHQQRNNYTFGSWGKQTNNGTLKSVSIKCKNRLIIARIAKLSKLAKSGDPDPWPGVRILFPVKDLGLQILQVLQVLQLLLGFFAFQWKLISPQEESLRRIRPGFWPGLILRNDSSCGDIEMQKPE